MIALPRAGFRPMTWANGGGVTHEVAASPAGASMDDFDWRVSLAEVRESGPFSALPGVDRLLLLVDGAGMTLRIDGAVVHASKDEPVSFAGECEASCTDLNGGPTLDLNVMTRRGRCSASLAVVPGGVLQCVDGERVLVLDLESLDAVLLEPGESAVAERAAVARFQIVGGGEPACSLAQVCPECGGLGHHRDGCVSA